PIGIPRLQSKLSVVATAVSCPRHLMLPPFWNVLLNVGNASFSFPTSTLGATRQKPWVLPKTRCRFGAPIYRWVGTPSSSYKMPRSFCGTDFVPFTNALPSRSEEHTSELQSRFDLVCRLLLEKKINCGWTIVHNHICCTAANAT